MESNHMGSILLCGVTLFQAIPTHVRNRLLHSQTADSIVWDVYWMQA